MEFSLKVGRFLTTPSTENSIRFHFLDTFPYSEETGYTY